MHGIVFGQRVRENVSRPSATPSLSRPLSGSLADHAAVYRPVVDGIDADCWFWWEPDACRGRQAGSKRLRQAYKAWAQTLFMGVDSAAEGPHERRGGVSEACLTTTRAHYMVTRVPFDLVLSGGHTVASGTIARPLIGHYRKWLEQAKGKHFTKEEIEQVARWHGLCSRDVPDGSIFGTPRPNLTLNQTIYIREIGQTPPALGIQTEMFSITRATWVT